MTLTAPEISPLPSNRSFLLPIGISLILVIAASRLFDTAPPIHAAGFVVMPISLAVLVVGIVQIIRLRKRRPQPLFFRTWLGTLLAAFAGMWSFANLIRELTKKSFWQWLAALPHHIFGN